MGHVDLQMTYMYMNETPFDNYEFRDNDICVINAMKPDANLIMYK